MWIRATGGDIEWASYSGGVEKTIVPALLLPNTTSSSDRVELKSGKTGTYSFGTAKASYQYDANGLSTIDVSAGGGGKSYRITRSSIGPSNADASNFTIRPKKTAASRLAQLSGNLLGPSDSKVSATAGGRGVSGKGMKLADGGDYDALLKLENRDEAWRQKLDTDLAKFQSEGKVGKEQGNQ